MLIADRWVCACGATLHEWKQESADAPAAQAPLRLRIIDEPGQLSLF